MDGSNLALFFAASWILIITPGPDMIYVITKGVSQGRKAGVISAIGVTLGILVHTIFAACGLAVILKTSAMVFLAVKFVGAGYLVFLGIKAIKDKTALTFHTDQHRVRIKTVFIQGVLSNVLNPKIALFFLAFLPQFVNPRYGNASVQMVGLGLIFAVFGVIFLVLLGYFSGTIGSWISRRRHLTQKIRWFTGGVLIFLGLRLAFMDRR